MADGSNCYPKEAFDIEGRAGTWTQSIAKKIQLFGQLEIAGVPNAVGLFGQGRQWQCMEPEGRERLWLVETFVVEAYRNGEGPFFPLTQSQIVSGATGLGSQRGVVQLQVDIENYAGGGRLRMDAGQQVELWAIGLSAQLLTPAGTIEVFPNGGQTIIGLAFAVFDSLFSVAITPIENTRGKKGCQFTTWAHVPINTQAVIEIPAMARRVQIRQTAAGAASAAWTAEVTGTLATSPGFNIPFVGRQTDIVGLGYATHLRPDLDAANARDFEIVYFMEP